MTVGAVGHGANNLLRRCTSPGTKWMLARLLGTPIKKGGAHGPWNTTLAARRANSHYHSHRSSLSLTLLRALASLAILQETFSCPTRR
jgi:hypothetical protein